MQYQQPLTVAVAGEIIPWIEAGLGYFLYTALQKLAAQQPTWTFEVMAVSSFRELDQLSLPNVRVHYYEQTRTQIAMKRLLRGHISERLAERIVRGVGRRMPSRAMRASWGDLNAAWSALSRRADVVWAPHYSFNWPDRDLAWTLSRVRIPIVLTIHDIHPAFYPDDWSPAQLSTFWNVYKPFTYRCQQIITHTRFQANAIVERLGVAPDRVDVTPCPPLIDVEELLKWTSEQDHETPCNIPQPFALYPGSTGYTHKNHIRLLLAWAELRRRMGDACPHLVCTAKGHHWPALRALIDALELSEVAHFTDIVNTRDLAGLYRDCALVIVPTLYEGGGSGPVAEACLLGKPVVCSRIPQIEEQLAAHGCQAAFCDPESVTSIADAAQNAMTSLRELEAQATRNQQALLPRTAELWADWARFYVQRFACAARSAHEDEKPRALRQAVH